MKKKHIRSSTNSAPFCWVQGFCCFVLGAFFWVQGLCCFFWGPFFGFKDFAALFWGPFFGFNDFAVFFCGLFLGSRILLLLLVLFWGSRSFLVFFFVGFKECVRLGPEKKLLDLAHFDFSADFLGDASRKREDGERRSPERPKRGLFQSDWSGRIGILL